MAEESGEWLECVVDNDYEIFSEYPYPIRRKGSDKVISESISKSLGYVECSLNRKTYRKHRIIGQQFIPNPNNLPQIDHINGNRSDNRLENLRWVSVSDNQRNKTRWGSHQFVFIDELPETAEPLERYNNHEFDDLWIDYENQKLYLFNGVKYRELLQHQRVFSSYYRINDREGKTVYLPFSVLFD